MQHRDVIVLKKIIDEITVEEEMLADIKLEDFLGNELLKRAVSMTIINIGELIKIVSDETRLKYPEVPWKEAAGLRDIAAHRYQTLRMEDVYNTATSELPVIKQQLISIVASNCSEETAQPK